MAEKASKIWALGLLLAVALAAASLAVSLTVTYGSPSQKTVTTTCTATQTVTTTTTYTTTMQTTPKGELSVILVSSVGSCFRGDLEKPTLTFERDGEYVLLRYAEQTSVPCFRHVITRSIVLERWPPIIDIALKLEPTSDVCIECVGVVETTLQVGPVVSGTDIVVNGLRIVV